MEKEVNLQASAISLSILVASQVFVLLYFYFLSFTFSIPFFLGFWRLFLLPFRGVIQLPFVKEQMLLVIGMHSLFRQILGRNEWELG